MNFELDLPLEHTRFGTDNPFYVRRPGDPAARLYEELLGPFREPPKLFFSGHRGCGKSTELERLAVDRQILAQYWPIHFTIRDEGDVNNIDFKDVLLAISGRLYRTYRDYKQDGFPDQLEKELNTWRGTVVEEITRGPRLKEAEISAEFSSSFFQELAGPLSVFFPKLSAKMKLEPKTRQLVRQVIERGVTGLIDQINLLATTIEANEKRTPLILIDDLDKIDLASAKEMFFHHREPMLQPTCAIVYTVASGLFYSFEFEAIRDRAVFLPNISLRQRGGTGRDEIGFSTMREFIVKRIKPDLITPAAIEGAIESSGGVFRELARVMRAAVQRAGQAKATHVEVDHVRRAEAEIQGEYRRLLGPEERAMLRDVHACHVLKEPSKAGRLLQILALLEYNDADEPWWDVHPALLSYLAEMELSGYDRPI
ncbi:MAG TPA: hypothetical protein VLA19_07430 [Herpetosiphonaceae bacterium]|nr:hypothetical protein [Herpetosiphonaceae bacterium]